MKKRLDQLLVERKLAKSRQLAQRLILAGEVFVNGQLVTKVGFLIPEDVEIEVKKKFPYVSRGAKKIEAAAKEFKIDFKNKAVCDVGASTGGFTDFALQHGAKK
ncbi:MAG: TlyA family rRNA (cytidine-2'-O)-methyltransferase, partial [Candidatus Aenigmarchaeota archaeon]|nr:TlyA family rRNA (cytidine-2'-O)-methyltransferase [Candidatus Aenigmarchaeota archaeon]